MRCDFKLLLLQVDLKIRRISDLSLNIGLLAKNDLYLGWGI